MTHKAQKPERKNVDGTTIQVGMPLVDKHGNYIGVIKEIQEKGFVVDRSNMQYEELFVPYWVCLHDGPEQIMLELDQNEVNTNVWRTPESSD